jgi:two-component system chemotaxis sensor kinase CheA
LADKLSVDKYKQVFLEEARDILVELESTLLELNGNRDDMEVVGRTFRAMHTIKGSGSMFGFDDVAEFTHHLENAYDEVRNGQLRVTTELVDLSLRALDQIRAMLDQAAGHGTVDSVAVAEILAGLLRLTGSSAAGPVHFDALDAVPVSASADGMRDWRIRFAPGPGLMQNGSNPLLLLRELRQLGTLRLEANMEAVPPLAELDPECCYISWEMTLTTSSMREEIQEVFLFVEDNCELTIEPCPGECPAPSAAVIVQEAPEEKRSGLLRRADDKGENATNIRVPTIKLDQFVDLVGELVTVQARLGEIASRHDDPDMLSVSEEVERLTAALRENSMSIRMVPIRATFERFRRLVHDLARDLHKEVELTIEGADTELDKTVIDQLNDPLMHLIRNSMDHGIESSEARLAAGKPAMATILLSARYEGANVLICVSDDGGGISAEAVRARAIKRGLIAADAQLSESEVFELILTPGFSTAPVITDVSGRGVGMDVVRQRVEALRGTIHIASKLGNGTGVTLRLPLTLAIIDGLLVRIDTAFFVLPLANTLECVELTRQDVALANGKHVAIVRGEIIPYIRLREYLDIRTGRPEREQIMIAETEDGRFGFVVDEVLGDHQTVIKNLGRLYRNVHFVSGATILGNGSLALILDPNRIVQDAIRTTSLRPRDRTLSLPPPSVKGNQAALMNSS